MLFKVHCDACGLIVTVNVPPGAGLSPRLPELVQCVGCGSDQVESRPIPSDLAEIEEHTKLRDA
jgi:hypothetical protein